jgi:hypothetical protein
MKVQNIKTNINEAMNKKIIMDEESYFEGHDFVTRGKDIGGTIDIDLPLIKINKDTLIVKWNGKLELHNDGVYAFNIQIKSVTADSEEDADSQTQSGPLNFNGFDFVVTKRKNPEVAEVQVFIESVYVNTHDKKVLIEFVL